MLFHNWYWVKIAPDIMETRTHAQFVEFLFLGNLPRLLLYQNICCFVGVVLLATVTKSLKEAVYIIYSDMICACMY